MKRLYALFLLLSPFSAHAQTQPDFEALKGAKATRVNCSTQTEEDQGNALKTLTSVTTSVQYVLFQEAKNGKTYRQLIKVSDYSEPSDGGYIAARNYYSALEIEERPSAWEVTRTYSNQMSWSKHGGGEWKLDTEELGTTQVIETMDGAMGKSVHRTITSKATTETSTQLIQTLVGEDQEVKVWIQTEFPKSSPFRRIVQTCHYQAVK